MHTKSNIKHESDARAVARLPDGVIELLGYEVTEARLEAALETV